MTKEAILGLWEAVKETIRTLWGIAKDAVPFAVKDYFDDPRSAIVFVLWTGFVVLATVTWTRHRLPGVTANPWAVPAQQCAMTKEDRAQLFCYEKATSPKGYLPVAQCKK